MNTLPHLTQVHDRHLTDEQFYSLLPFKPEAAIEPDALDSANQPLRLHLAACADCRAELATISASLANFREAATNLACAQRSQQRAVAPARTPGFRRFVWSASLAVAAIVFAASLSLNRPSHVEAPVAAVPPVATATLSDEALLDNIQQDLSTSIPPSLEPLSVPAASGSTNTSN